MKFICEQQKLSKALTIVSKAVTSRTTIPILKGIMLDLHEDGKLTLSASDLDISIKNTIETEAEEAGSVIVMAKLFGDIIRKLPNREVEFTCDEDYNVTIRCMNSEFKIVGMSTDEFPNVNRLDEDTRALEFDIASVKKMIDRTAFAASSDEARGIITGMLVEAGEDQLSMVAIDGYRMAINRKEQVNPEPIKFIVSAKIISEVSRILGEADSEEETGTLYLSRQKVIFSFGNIQAELKLMEGEFIRYKDILPKSSKITLTIDRGLLLESIERASLLSKAGKNNLIRMKLQDTLVTITSNSEEGNVREEVAVVKQGDDLEIGFNSQYMMDILKSIPEDEIVMLFNTPITPCLIRPTEGSAFEYLILPVRIN